MSSATRKLRRAEARRRAKEMLHGSMEAHQGPERDGAASCGAPWSHGEQESEQPEVIGLPDGQVRAVLALTADIAKVFRVHPKTIERWRKLEGLPCLRIRGTVRYDLSDVLRWASARKEGV